MELDAAVTVLSWLPWQGLAESHADEAAGRALRRQDLLAGLHNTVQQRQSSTAQQGATHQALLDRQACQTAQHDCNNKSSVSVKDECQNNETPVLAGLNAVVLSMSLHDYSYGFVGESVGTAGMLQAFVYYAHLPVLCRRGLMQKTYALN